MREGIGPDGAVGCRLTDEHWSPDANTEDELAEAARVLSDAGLIDYLSVALGSLDHVPRVELDRPAVADRAQRDRCPSRGG